ncbi:MAG: radical SAM protein [Planctomycetota bacterium]|jgi:radical SAM superfamily enzyme YgiQ (UPF0313 family)|nr:radical SAM protein [Planctomycetota bacterium]
MRIAFVAMSGVRVRDAELMARGLTLPGFVERSQVIASLPSLGLLTLAGMTPEHHEMVYLEAPDQAAADAISTDFDLMAISSFSAQIDEGYALADRVRASGCTVVMGGPHVSVCTDEAAAHCDAVIIGEGEMSWPQVLADAERGAVQPRYGQLGTSFDLRQAPMPRHSLLDPERYNRLTVQTSRGCPHRCEFCAATPLMSPGYRQKPMDLVLAEIDAIQNLWSHPFLEFADDNSCVDRRYWKNLCRAMIPRRLRWFTEADLSVAEDEELLALMAESGCAQILIGLESPEAGALGGIELRGDWKRRRHDRYLAAIERVQSYGISVNGCFILGLDGHTPAIFDQVYHFVQDSDLTEVQVTLMTAFPGTPLYRRLYDSDRLLDATAWDRCTLFDINYQPSHMSVAELRSGFHELVSRLYSPEASAARKTRFRALRRSRRRSARLAS